MKTTARIFLALSLLVLAFHSDGYAGAANIEPLGMLSIGAGAERETGSTSGCTNIAAANEIFGDTGGFFRPHGCTGSAGARGMGSVLGVLPFGMPNLGLQMGAKYTGGDGSRFGATVGPVYGWGSGIAGVLVDYQRRTRGSANFFWITPAVSLFFGDMNVNLSFTKGISPIQEKMKTGENLETSEMFNRFFIRYVPTSRAQGSVSYFPMDALEVNVGVQVNTFAGPTKFIQGAGIGPVASISWMPIENVSLDLVKARFDNRSRYNVESGISWFFSTGSTKGTNLKEIRRKYIQRPDPSVATYGPVSVFPAFTGF